MLFEPALPEGILLGALDECIATLEGAEENADEARLVEPEEDGGTPDVVEADLDEARVDELEEE